MYTARLWDKVSPLTTPSNTFDAEFLKSRWNIAEWQAVGLLEEDGIVVQPQPQLEGETEQELLARMEQLAYEANNPQPPGPTPEEQMDEMQEILAILLGEHDDELYGRDSDD